MLWIIGNGRPGDDLQCDLGQIGTVDNRKADSLKLARVIAPTVPLRQGDIALKTLNILRCDRLVGPVMSDDKE